MSINVEKTNFNQITETIESIFNKARSGSEENKKAIPRDQSVNSRNTRNRGSVRNLKSNFRHSTMSRNQAKRRKLKSSNISSIGKNSSASLVIDQKRKSGSSKVKSKKRRGFKRSGSHFSNKSSTFGKYLSHARLKTQPRKRSHKRMKSRQIKHSSTNSIFSRKTFSKVIQNFKNAEKQISVSGKSSGATSKNNSTIYNNNQFAGYFSKNKTGERLKTETQSQQKSKLKTFTKLSSNNYRRIGSRQSINKSELSSIDASSQSSFGVGQFTKKFKFEELLKDTKEQNIENFSEKSITNERNSQDANLKESPPKKVKQTQIMVSEKSNPQKKVAISSTVSNTTLVYLTKKNNDFKLGSYLKKSQNKSINTKKIRSKQKSNQIEVYAAQTQSKFPNIKKFLSPKGLRNSPNSSLLPRKNFSMSRQNSQSRLLRQSLTLSKFKRIGQSQSKIKIKHVNQDSKQPALFQLNSDKSMSSGSDISKNGFTNTSKPMNQEQNVTLKKILKKSVHKHSFGNRDLIDFEKINKKILSLKNNSNNNESPQLNSSNNIDTEGKCLPSLSPNKSQVPNLKFGGDISVYQDVNQGSYYQLYVQQRNQNQKLKETINQLVEELAEQKKKSEVNLLFISCISLLTPLQIYKNLLLEKHHNESSMREAIKSGKLENGKNTIKVMIQCQAHRTYLLQIPPILRAGERLAHKLDLSGDDDLACQKSIEEIIEEGQQMDLSIEKLQKSIEGLNKREKRKQMLQNKQWGARSKVPKLNFNIKKYNVK